MNRWIAIAISTLGAACSGISQNPTGSSSGSGGSSGSTGTSGTTGTTGSVANLIGTWDVTTTPTGGASVETTVIIGQDSLTITSPSFNLTATKAASVLSFDDMEDASTSALLTAAQTSAAFNAGIIPFELGGTWTMQTSENGGSPSGACTLSVSGTEIDGSCHDVGSGDMPVFSFTTTKSIAADSSFGDFGGSWTNRWIWGSPADGGSGPYACGLTFFGSGITTMSSGGTENYPDGGAPPSGSMIGSPLAGITFTYDGANTISGSVQGSGEFSATRR